MPRYLPTLSSVGRITGMKLCATLTVLLALAASSDALAQGSICGTVTLSGGGAPAPGNLAFVGYLDDTDEEIRTESCFGAGYDAGNWFDDFQNYQTRAEGNPYRFHFIDQTDGEGYVLSGLQPGDSYHEENIVLSPATWPSQPSGLAGVFVGATSVQLSWDDVPDITWHVYRRQVPSNGSFYRIDDPYGSLGNPGVAEASYTDNNVDDDNAYDYLLIPEDETGQWGLHSAVLNVESSSSCCLIRGDVDHSGVMPIDISDLVHLVNYMFLEGAPPPCWEEGDIDASGTDPIDISDLVYLVDYMFKSGPAPAPCL